MQEDLKAQKNAGKLVAEKNAGRFEGSGKCRGV